ncbi:hypothetical protein BBO99_00006852 [Phytophthora kernoviae]|uniref:Uncharacterized protein n=2 Tax=Phytophthora kernoviae TaxID=325452 RepID=A0A3R7NDE2_9STRA|nr:hypothetical protein G195_010231 [Phytophthora kernoviae 00238/432]KAG2510750.1 hypothetical protein JM16_008452 [Phytophthora kernoviae]KAG2513588.1 hypothetical protein JM18_008436 [Phytophthora kernoviae]RLN06626.1 hypothetical protein BBI17_007301 [Phytophthora kernoviae]RLN77300.1 hypothetical protein BBO99_00006852 [Phytophthora kernoviae]
MPIPQLSNDPVENSKQVLKALKCVAFSSMQVSDMIKRKRERLVKRLQAVTDETELLRTDIIENVMNQRQRLQQMTEIEEDIERAQTLGNPEISKELSDELKAMKEEDHRENVLLRNLKRTVRSRVRVKKGLMDEQRAVEKSMAIFNCKNNLIQNMDEFDEDGESSRASQSDYDLSDLDDDIDMDVGRAVQESNNYPKIRVAQPGDDQEEEKAEQSSVSAWSFDSDSQTGSSAKDGRRRSVSFSPLPMAGLVEEDIVMHRPQVVEEVQSENELEIEDQDDCHRRFE